MGLQPLEKLLPHAGYSIYRLVLMAARRATELADGAPKLIDFPSSLKATTIALDEIAAGKIDLREIAEAKQTQEKAKGKKKEKE